MNTFWTLLKESTIFQGLITVGVVGIWLYLEVSGQPISEGLQWAVGVVVGFFFGAKSSQTAARLRNGPPTQ